jgi:3-oxoacyl-[acyl-carrier protein] reductase
MQLEGQVALVTGASRGIGKAIANALMQEGAFVFGTATTTEGAATLTEESRGMGKGLPFELQDRKRAKALVEEIMTIKGKIDILVNNAGITRDNLLLRMSDEEWQLVIDSNLSGVFALTKEVVRPMLKARYGRIINLASVVGFMGNAGQTNYCAAKAGLVGFTKALAKEVASRSITVNCIAPGFIATDMTKSLGDAQKEQLLANIPIKRLGTSEDCAHAALFLASPLASYITGETIHVNGGMYMA